MDAQKDFSIHDVVTRQVTNFKPGGQQYTVTRVTIYVGPHGPFTEDFGPGQDYPATPEAINAWKQGRVTFAMAIDTK